MKIKRAWLSKAGLGEFKEITEDRARRELANAHGDNAIEKLQEEGKLETRFATYCSS